MRKPFQGVWNIIRFNWPFYPLSIGLAFLIMVFRSNLSEHLRLGADILVFLAVGLIAISLLVSYYVYDRSDFYQLNWLDHLQRTKNERIVNIHAGFDESSGLLENKFGGAEIMVCDFYDPAKHTAASIRRARQTYPPFPNTHPVSTEALPLSNNSADIVFAILSAHEIRAAAERRSFFIELNRVLSPAGTIVVVEHLRDVANYMAYNIGAFHFYPRVEWISIFRAARLSIENEIKITPFITAFFLTKDGTAS